MAGTKAGAAKMWETRRAMYGPSGRKPKSGTTSGKRSTPIDQALPLRVVIDDVEQSVKSFDRARVERLKQETALMVRDLGRRYRTSDKNAPAYARDIFKRERAKLQRWVRQRKAALPILEANARTIENKKHGRRYRV